MVFNTNDVLHTAGWQVQGGGCAYRGCPAGPHREARCGFTSGAAANQRAAKARPRRTPVWSS